ncbi:MAG: nicotinate (nicotinamide) nucleotide adenylyltransferase [Acidobacteria bacterium]|nr:MAG: nicotinate (nicotinamide) nucleotide adenylyltransferase [Acidobacteriota bacterium]
MERARRIGIFGGTFDPPHIAHILCATTAMDEGGLDEVVLMPAGDPYQKGAVASAEDRFAMTCLAAESSPDLSVSRMEIDRSGPSYSIETVDAFKAQSGGAEIFLIGGSDSIAGIRSWRHYERLLDEVGFVVIPRTPASVKEALAVLGTGPEVILVAGLAQLDISSTDIRARVAEGLPVGHLVPSRVVNYIREHGLYQD